MTEAERQLLALLGMRYPAIGPAGSRAEGAFLPMARIPDLGRTDGEALIAAADRWLVLSVTTDQAALQTRLGIPSGGTTFSVTGPDAVPVAISQASAAPYLGATVLFTDGAARGRRTTITDIRRANSQTYVTVKDVLDVGRGDTLSVLMILTGTPAKLQLTEATLGSSVVMQNAATATGLGTALPVSGDGVASLDVQITGTATITWKGVGPGGNTYTVQARDRSTGAVASTATASGLFEVNTRGLTSVYADVTAYTSGTVKVTGVAQPLAAAADQVALTGSLAPLPQSDLTIFDNAAVAANGFVAYDLQVSGHAYLWLTWKSGGAGTPQVLIINPDSSVNPYALNAALTTNQAVNGDQGITNFLVRGLDTVQIRFLDSSGAANAVTMFGFYS